MSGVELAGSRAVVTGGAGTIGSAVVDRLLAAGASSVVVVDNFTRGRPENLEAAEDAAHGRLQVVEGDINDPDLMAEVVTDADVLFHLAALRITQCAEQPRAALEALVDGTFTVVEAATAAGVRKIIASSSASVYGMATTFPTREDHHPYANDTLYGAAKTFNEGLLRSFHAMYGLDWVALRYFNVYGPRMDAHGVYTEVLIRWMERIEQEQPPLIHGTGHQTMDFVNVRDIARANLLAATSDVTDRVYNIASGTETSLRGLALALLEAMGSTLEPVYGPARAVNGVERRLADIGAAARDLGWVPEVPLADGLRELVAWWRSLSAAGVP